MNTADRVWERLEVSQHDAGSSITRLQAGHHDGCLFIRRQKGSLLIQVLPNSDADECLKQLGSDPGRVAIFYKSMGASN